MPLGMRPQLGSQLPRSRIPRFMDQIGHYLFWLLGGRYSINSFSLQALFSPATLSWPGHYLRFRSRKFTTVNGLLRRSLAPDEGKGVSAVKLKPTPTASIVSCAYMPIQYRRSAVAAR